MLNTVWGVVRDGRVELLESALMPDGARVLITVLDDSSQDGNFWQRLCDESLKAYWKNQNDDVFAELLKG